jgi:hypothetical protein
MSIHGETKESSMPKDLASQLRQGRRLRKRLGILSSFHQAQVKIQAMKGEKMEVMPCS